MADGDANGTLTVIKESAGMGRFEWGKATKPILIGAAAGGATLVVSQWYLADMFQTDGQDDEGAWWKRAASKIAIGVLGFMLLRKLSFAAALGVGIAGAVGGVHDLLVADEGPFKLNQKLNEWFGDEEPETTETTTTTGGAQGPMRARNVFFGNF